MLCPYLTPPQYLVFAEGVPALLYYSHIPAIVISVFIGAFILFKNPGALLNRLLSSITILFSLWAFFNLVLWTSVHSDVIVFLWSLFGLLYGLLAVTSIYFITVFLTKKDVSFVEKCVYLALLAPVLIFTPTAFNISGFDLDVCGSSGFEGIEFITYYTGLGVVALIWITVLLIYWYRKSDSLFRKQIVPMGTGLLLFLSTFFGLGYLASYLNDLGFATDYSIEQYGLFGMTIFMGVIAFLIVRYQAFNAGMLAAQALVFALIFLIGSQFAFVTSDINRVLVAITLVLTSVAGIYLIRSVQREVMQRERIEKLARELEKANKQQVTLIHFITHQIKGFVTKSRNIFSLMKEGDLGPIPEAMKPMIEEGFRSDTKGVNTIQEILNAANIKSGKVAYSKEPFDLKALVDEIGTDLKTAADTKGLALKLETGTEPLMYPGDKGQLVNALKNLIDNSIKYTLKGEVRVKLAQEGKTVRFTVEDTGVGITQEDMKNLFTEGGHGANSAKINVESTGFGLYIVKNIVEAHNGKVWAESNGEGKGSRFIVELPV